MNEGKIKNWFKKQCVLNSAVTLIYCTKISIQLVSVFVGGN